MKIGILTLPLHTNYGGILQAYALQTVLERMGHEVVVFDKPTNCVSQSLLREFVGIAKRVLRKILGKYKGAILTKNINKRIHIERCYTQSFIDKYINRLVVTTFEQCLHFDLDSIVVGSDQVWRALYFRSLWNADMSNAFLGFCNDNVTRIAYAASFGKEEWEFTEKETMRCSELIRKFAAVSTREESGIDLCRKYLHFEKCKQVLDPTMLLRREDYIYFFKTAGTPKSEGNLLCYILDENDDKTLLIKKISADKKLFPFRVNSRVEDPTAPIEERSQPPVEKWLRGFYDAEFVITDSFHACVFCILFNKPFIVMGNAERGMSRFISLLKIFRLERCLITSSKDYTIKDLDIDWPNVNSILEQKRKESISFLLNGLSL